MERGQKKTTWFMLYVWILSEEDIVVITTLNATKYPSIGVSYLLYDSHQGPLDTIEWYITTLPFRETKTHWILLLVHHSPSYWTSITWSSIESQL